VEKRTLFAMFDSSHEIEAADGTRLTLRGAASRALILEVRLPAGASAAPWLPALAGYRKRFDVLHGALIVDGTAVHAGERMTIDDDSELTLTAGLTEETHFVCDLRPAIEPGPLVVALEATLARASSAIDG
jgi:redox-sensitive bicupin YhaK (pirin superfamily)